MEYAPLVSVSKPIKMQIFANPIPVHMLLVVLKLILFTVVTIHVSLILVLREVIFVWSKTHKRPFRGSPSKNPEKSPIMWFARILK